MIARIAAGAAVVGVALVIGGAALIGVGAGRVGAAPQEARPARGLAQQEGTPRSRAVQQVVAVLQEGGEVNPAEVIAGLPGLGELARRRAEIAEQMMEFSLVKFVSPPSPSAERGTFHAAVSDYLEWSSRRLEAALDGAETDDDRRQALAGEVAKLRRVEEAYRELGEASGVGVSPQDLLALEFDRLELETQLVRLGAGGEH